MKKVLFIVGLVAIVYLLLPTSGTFFYLHNIRGVYVLLLAILISTMLTPLIIRVSYKFKILDYPNERKIHKEPIPRIGGVAVFTAFMVVMFRNFHFPVYILGTLIGCAVLFIFEIIDDIKSSSAFFRLFGQVVAAIIVISFGMKINIVPPIPGKEIIERVITVIWIVGITNAFNFLDGVDGLATGLAIINGICYFIIAWPTRQTESGYIQLAMIGACIGFLPYNGKPAKIFLGDSGATMLGFLLAVFAIIGTFGSVNPVIAAVIPLLIMAIPIFDMIYISFSRVKNGSVKTVKEWIEFTGKDHFHHRLLKLGLSEKVAVFFLYLLNLCLGIGAVILKSVGSLGALLVLLQAVIIFGIIIILMLAGRELT